MSDTLPVLIIDRDPARRRALRELLADTATVRVEAEAADPETGYQLVNQLKPAIVIFDLGSPPDPDLALVERLLVASPRSAVFVSAEGQRAETILRAVRAGAREFLVRPVSRTDLIAAIQRVARQRALASAESASRGKVITLFGCKGGRGTTVLALNLAVALAQSGAPAVGVDLDLQAGDLGLFLSLKPSYTISDAVENLDRLDALFLKSLLCHHPSGLSVLAAPEKIEEIDRITPLGISQLLTLLKASFAYVVVDTAPTYDERLFSVFDATDELLVVVSPDFSTLYHARRCLDLLDQVGYGPDKIKVLLNRCALPLGKAVKMAEEVLHRPVFLDFPEDGTVMASVLANAPLARNGTNSPFGTRVSALATKLDRRSRGAVPEPHASKGLLGFFRARPASISAR